MSQRGDHEPIEFLGRTRKTITIAIANAKGGVGKTTTAVHLACGLAMRTPKKRVLLVDMDSQGSASAMLGYKPADFDYVIIDSAPGAGPLLNSSLNAADLVIIPIDSNFFALLGVRFLNGIIAEIQETTNPRLSVLGYLVTLADNTIVCGEVRDVLIRNFGDLVFKQQIRRGVEARHAASSGLTLFEYAHKGRVACDYQDFVDEVMARLPSNAPEVSHE